MMRRLRRVFGTPDNERTTRDKMRASAVDRARDAVVLAAQSKAVREVLVAEHQYRIRTRGHHA